eukprot:366157-Chlamydomonas_euryale.AAC.13
MVADRDTPCNATRIAPAWTSDNTSTLVSLLWAGGAGERGTLGTNRARQACRACQPCVALAGSPAFMRAWSLRMRAACMVLTHEGCLHGPDA